MQDVLAGGASYAALQHLTGMNRTLVLVATRDRGLLAAALRQLSPKRFAVEDTADVSDVLRRTDSAQTPDVLLLDADVVLQSSHTDLIGRLRQLHPSLRIVVQAPRNHLNQVVRAIHMGANGWVWTPVQEGELSSALAACFESTVERSVPADKCPTDFEQSDDSTFFVGISPVIRKLRANMERVAATDVPVLCVGETGTGKECAASWLHRLSSRANAAFVKVNCAAVPAGLLEKELFGTKHSSLPNHTASLGKFVLSDKGTLFLNEITAMPGLLQARVLDIIQERHARGVSGKRATVSARLVAAASMNVNQALAEKRLHEGLYDHLSECVFEIPPLRERREDIPMLLRRYLALHARRFGLPDGELPNDLWQRCVRYDWPGNIRELETFAKRYLLFGRQAAELCERDLLPESAGAVAQRGTAPTDLKAYVRSVRDEAETLAIARALQQTNWNRKAAADVLHISYQSLLAKIRQYRLDRQKGSNLSGSDRSERAVEE